MAFPPSLSSLLSRPPRGTKNPILPMESHATTATRQDRFKYLMKEENNQELVASCPLLSSVVGMVVKQEGKGETNPLWGRWGGVPSCAGNIVGGRCGVGGGGGGKTDIGRDGGGELVVVSCRCSKRQRTQWQGHHSLDARHIVIDGTSAIVIAIIAKKRHRGMKTMLQLHHFHWSGITTATEVEGS